MALEDRTIAVSPRLTVNVRTVVSREDEGGSLTLQGNHRQPGPGPEDTSQRYYIYGEPKRDFIKGLKRGDQVLTVEIDYNLMAIYGPLTSDNFYQDRPIPIG